MAACKVCGNDTSWAPGHPRGLWERTVLSWLRFGPVRCEKCGFRQIVHGGWTALGRSTAGDTPVPTESAEAPTPTVARTPPPLPRASVDIPFPENPTPNPDLAFPDLINEMRHAEKRLGLDSAADGPETDESPTGDDR